MIPSLICVGFVRCLLFLNCVLVSVLMYCCSVCVCCGVALDQSAAVFRICLYILNTWLLSGILIVPVPNISKIFPD